MTATPAEIDALIGAGPLRRVWVERRPQTALGWLAALGGGLGWVLLALILDALTEENLAWLVLPPMVALIWGRYELRLGERWALVVEHVDGNRRTFFSDQRGSLDQHAELIRPRCLEVEPVPALLSQRLIFLDAARALAIVAMVFAHFTDQLLDPALHGTPFGAAYLATRGFTAPLFFVVSGWAFAVAMLPRLARTGMADFSGKLRRAATLLLWGYALTLPWWAEGFPFTETTSVWIPFWTAGVLQTLGGALLIATVLLWLVRTPLAFLALCAGAAVLAVVGAPWALAHCAAWPTVVRGFFDAQGAGGGFPIAPWGGYFFAGITSGGALWLRQVRPLASGAVLGAIAAVAFLAQRVLPGTEALLVWRFAWVAAVLAVATLLTAKIAKLPPALRLLGQHALTFYVAHMVLLWGAPSFPGLVHRFRPELGWLACLALAAGCLAITGFGLWLLGRTRALLRPPGARRTEG